MSYESGGGFGGGGSGGDWGGGYGGQGGEGEIRRGTTQVSIPRYVANQRKPPRVGAAVARVNHSAQAYRGGKSNVCMAKFDLTKSRTLVFKYHESHRTGRSVVAILGLLATLGRA